MNAVGIYVTRISKLSNIDSLTRKVAISVIVLIGLLVQPAGLLAADSPQQLASNCEAQYKPLTANFTIQRLVVSRKRPSFASDAPSSPALPIQSSAQQLELTREGGIEARVAHTFPDINQSEIWNRTRNGFMRVVKHFNSHARAIEYEPIDIGSPTLAVGWDEKFHLVPNGLYDELIMTMASDAESVGKSMSNCVYQFEQSIEDAGVVVELEWNEQLQLPQSMVVLQTNKNSGPSITEVRTTIKPTSIDDNAESVERKFKEWDSHHTMDFADIGDNESDPFLMTMINFGFISHGASGFYDSSGEQIGGNVNRF